MIHHAFGILASLLLTLSLLTVIAVHELRKEQAQATQQKASKTPLCRSALGPVFCPTV